jgi:demethylmenaquinone methyltransferase/2-methoxy-6-polyprenyl-1,4-benzoquinol methylase
MTTVVDKSGERVREMFGEISGRYDLLNHLLSGGSDVYWRWRAVRACPPRGDLPILDVCTGTGDLAIAYWKKGRGKVPVIGTDFTPEMLRIAREKFARLRSSFPADAADITFQPADTQALPFDDDCFQIVSVAFGLRNVADTRRGLAEMIRVCRPGGRVVILEFSLPGNRLLCAVYLWYFRHVLPTIGQWLARNRQSAYNYLPASVAEFPYGKALADLLTNCGLVNVTWTPLTFGIATLYVGTKPEIN